MRTLTNKVDELSFSHQGQTVLSKVYGTGVFGLIQTVLLTILLNIVCEDWISILLLAEGFHPNSAKMLELLCTAFSKQGTS